MAGPFYWVSGSIDLNLSSNVQSLSLVKFIRVVEAACTTTSHIALAMPFIELLRMLCNMLYLKYRKKR